MITPKVFIAHVSKGNDGKYVIEEGSTRNVMTSFDGAYYQSADGVESVGQPRVYTEEYPESKELDVYFPEDNNLKSTDFTLKLCFIAPSDKKDNEAIDYIMASYDAFVSYISGRLVMYWDNVRKRKLLLALVESIKPSITSVMSGREYISVSFKFKNVYGRSFSLDDVTELPLATT